MALTQPKPRKYESAPELEFYGVAQGVVCYQGGLAVLKDGYVRPGYVATDLTVVGIFDFTADVLGETVDNSGGNNGDVNARVRRGVFPFANKSTDLVTAADVGKPCYICDDDTVSRTDAGGTLSVAGTVRRVDSDGVWVELSAVNGVALAAEITAREAVSTDLASTANAKGASLIGIEDSAAKFTATTVEGALAEGIDGRRLGTVANDATLAGAVVTHLIAVPATASGTKSITLNATHGKFRVLDAHFIKAGTTGATTDAVKLTDGTHDITDSLALDTKAAGAIVRATSISPTYGTLAAGATLVANWTKDAGGTAEGTLVVTGVRSA